MATKNFFAKEERWISKFHRETKLAGLRVGLLLGVISDIYYLKGAGATYADFKQLALMRCRRKLKA